MSTKYVLPVRSLALASSCSFSHRLARSFVPFSGVVSLSSFQHLVPLWNTKKYYYFLFFHYITRTFLANSMDATIIFCPIFFFALFIFLEERSHLVFRLLYN